MPPHRKLPFKPVAIATWQTLAASPRLNEGWFSISGFDETFPGAWEWDLKRLAASLILAARDRNFTKTIADEVVRAAAASYRERMSEFAEMEVIDRWYAEVSIDELKANFGKDPVGLSFIESKAGPVANL